MALSPWHVASRMSCEEVAALLSGYDIAKAKAGYVKEHLLHEVNEWEGVILQAVQDGSLKAVYKAALLRRPREVWAVTKDGRDTRQGDVVSLSQDLKNIELASLGGVSEGWVEQDDFDQSLSRDAEILELRLTFERAEVYRWLKASGAADDDIPEALRVMPAERQQQSEELHPRREGTYQRIIATLLVMQYSAKELEEPFRLADQVLDDCQAQNVKAPASRNTLGELFKQLPRVQKAPED